MPNPFDTIRNLFAEAEYQKALKSLKALSEQISDRDLKNNIIMCCARINKNHKDVLLNFDDNTVEVNKAVKAILELVDDLEHNWIQSEISNNELLICENTDDATPIDVLVEQGELDMGIERILHFFSLIDVEQLKIAELNVRRSGQVVRPESEKAMKEALVGMIERIKGGIPNFFRIMDFPTIGPIITDQQQIIELVIEKKFSAYYREITFHDSGHSGWYFKAKKIGTNENVVIVILKVKSVKDLPPIEEINQIMEFKHSANIVKIDSFCFECLPAYVVLDYIDGITLDKALNLFGGFPIAYALDIMIQIVNALEKIRKNKILHTNIRPSKIFIDTQGTPFISSLDIIKLKNDSMRTLSRFKEECQYLSQEVLGESLDCSDIKAVEKSDQFSLGLLLLEMIGGKPLFKGGSIAKIFHKRNEFFKKPAKNLNKVLGERMYSKPLKSLLKRMLAVDPKNRYPDLSDVLIELKSISARALSESPLLNSFDRCLRHKPNLVKEFYERFFQQIPGIEGHFKSTSRQYMMLRFAVYVVFEIETKEEYLIKILKSNSHSHYLEVSLFEIFLNTLRDTVKDLLEEEWDEGTMREPWDDKIKKTLAVVERTIEASRGIKQFDSMLAPNSHIISQ